MLSTRVAANHVMRLNTNLAMLFLCEYEFGDALAKVMQSFSHFVFACLMLPKPLHLIPQKQMKYEHFCCSFRFGLGNDVFARQAICLSIT